MSKIIKSIVLSLTLLSGSLVASFAFAGVASAQVSEGPQNNICSGATDQRIPANTTNNPNSVSGSGSSCSEAGQGTNEDVNNLISTIINLFSVIVGLVAVIMIVYGGFRYITSGGDSGNVTAAKNTILYAIIGLIIVALAQIIVRFVLAKATSTSVG